MPTLHWIGKDKIINHHQEVPYKVLNHEYGFYENGKTDSSADSRNLIINGDNLEALKSLLPKYEGKVNCIYIDPPYNTGNESWVYNDNVNSPKIKKWLGKVVGKESEDLTRHDKWLCMMYPRLKLLHKLLAKEGAIFISIDDNEQANLKLMLDEIFGHKNIIANLIWDLGTGTQAGHFVRAHEYILSYFKNKDLVPNFRGGEGIIEHSALKKISFKNPSVEFTFPSGTRWDAPDDYELFETWGGSEKTTIVNGRMIAKDGKLKEEVVLSAGFAQKNQMISWFNNQITFDSKGQLVTNFYFNKNGILRYEKERSVINPPTVLKEIASTKNGSTNLQSIFNEQIFDFPKPVELVQYLVDLITDKNSIILDSFAGSGTTAHAVLNLNKQDGGNRKFILIEMEDYAETITAERVKRVINGYADKEATGGSFDYYTLGEPLFDENNNLNETVGIEKIREYVWFTETRIPYTIQKLTSPFLGIYNDTSYYFIYEKDNLTTLDYDSLAQYVQQKAERYIIYADNCLLPETFMREKNIEFKKIPRDITRF
ncbi:MULTISPECIES: site-specific DNA-methyltransferase [unclassified Flavobacterium]|jgi:adenine-specific DNA-methyltransferase|uniref:site-specific DNA-methyltransferase n=1 Tax=unclassified Flavobacterium TaxID=196869 RepID=UPI0025BBF64D|nr:MULTISPECIES: site-specific DNA-methyltransferase [unclassified Flavobacterium]